MKEIVAWPAAVSDGWIYAGLLTLLVWAPLPLGSNRIWGIGVLLGLALLLLGGTLVAWRHCASAAFERWRYFDGRWACWRAW